MKRGIFSTVAVVCVATALFPSAGRPNTSPLVSDRPVIEPSTAAQRQFEREPKFLGFQEGEERRYVLGPPEALGRGESATWSIHLRELLGDPPDAIFVLTHEWHRAETMTDVPLGTITHVQSEGELRVNGHGFPLELEFKTQRHLAGYGDEVYTIRYRYEDGSYRKNIATQGTDWSHTAMIRGHEHLDREIPSGLYALLPVSPDCSVTSSLSPWRASAVVPPRRTVGSGTSPTIPPGTTTRFADNRRCRESLFANPGLVSLMMPELWEDGSGERGFLLFMPTGPTEAPGVSLGGAAGGVVAASQPRGTGPGMRPDANSRAERLRYRERVEVEVGRRSVGAWLFDRMGDFEAIYVDDDNVVLRVDLSRWGRGLSIGGTAASVDPTQMSGRRLYIRLLFPSEY